ncbi:alpha/beta fold hydrolase [Arthrobacter sp. JSM 101049]|uniref:alpha/beta fold hydrolase n=1 Tax=Arthrobacter sp. JSM 101049 TaxID=929097 RepID=UPI0035657A1A
MGPVFRTSSGRRVGVHEHDHGTRRTVVLCHPTGGSGAVDPDPALSAARGIRLLAVDRPGYGRSDPLARADDSAVEQAAADLAEVLDARDAREVGLVGWGEGGWTAAALAAARPELVYRLVLVATPALDTALPYLPPELRAAARGPQDPALVADAIRGVLGFTSSVPEAAAVVRVLHRSSADDAVLERPGAREALATMVDAAYAHGDAGVLADLLEALARPPAIDPETIRAKTLLLYGQNDPAVPPRHATWWKKRLPHSRIEITPRAGHLLLFGMWSRTLSHLAPKTTTN